MALFTYGGSPDEAIRAIKQVCEERGVRYREIDDLEIEVKTEQYRHIFTAGAENDPISIHDSSVILHVGTSLRVPKSVQLHLSLAVALLMAFVAFYLFSTSKAPSRQYPIIVLAVCSLLLAISVGAFYRRIEVRGANSFTRIIRALESSGPVIQYAPFDVEGYGFFPCIVAPLFISILLCGITGMIGIFSAMFVGIPAIGILTSFPLLHLFRKRWQDVFMRTHSIKLQASTFLLFSLAIAITIYGGNAYALGQLERGTPLQMQEFLSHVESAFHGVLTFSRRSMPSYPREGLQDPKIHPLTHTVPLIAATIVALSLSAAQLIHGAQSLRREHTIDPKASILSHSLGRTSSPAASTRLLLFVHLAFSGVFYWICMLIFADATFFLFFGAAKINPALGTVLEATTHHMRSEIGVTGTVAFFVDSALLFPIAFPGLVLGVALVAHLVGFLYKEITFPKTHAVLPHPVARVISEFVLDVSKKEQIAEPSIKIMKNMQSDIHSYASLIRRTSCIAIPQETIKILHANELKALVAHELYHIKNDTIRLETRSILSLICVFSRHAHFFFGGYAELERKADAFATRIMGSPKELSSALAKLSAMSRFKRNCYKTTENTSITPSKRFLAVLFGTLRRTPLLFIEDTFFQARYPTLVSRLAWLRKYEKQGEIFE